MIAHHRESSIVGSSADAPNFHSVQRFWDAHTQRWTARVLPGQYYVTNGGEAISTVLGSCIAACIGDPIAGIGGMNHFLLPDGTMSACEGTWTDPTGGLATRYGSFAMERLINALLRCGLDRRNLQVKLFGGARLLQGGFDVGASNIAFVRKYLALEHLEIMAEDLGEVFPRRIVYFPATGKVRVRRLRPVTGDRIATRERHYLEEVVRTANDGVAEIFG